MQNEIACCRLTEVSIISIIDLGTLIEKLQAILRLLFDVQQNSYSVRGYISWFEPILEAAEESISLLANALSIGTPFLIRNPSIEFLDNLQDERGNPAQRKWRITPPLAWSEPISDWLYDIASYLIEFKDRLLRNDFHGQFQKKQLPRNPEIDKDFHQTPEISKEQPRKVATNKEIRYRNRHFCNLRRMQKHRRKQKN